MEGLIWNDPLMDGLVKIEHNKYVKKKKCSA